MKSLIERFRSKPDWQSPDPAVRAEAVLRLPSAEREALLTVALEDPEARVRRAAARKLDDKEALARLASSDEDPAVREEAASRLVHLAAHASDEEEGAAALESLSDPRHLATVARQAALPGVRETAVAALEDTRALASVVREAEDPATRLLALGRIDDAPTLLSLALKSDRKAVAVAAVERLDEPEALREVADKARSSAAARRARARLETGEPATRAAASPEEEERERQAYERARAEQEREAAEQTRALESRTGLCASVERAQGEEIPPEVERARAAWAALAPLAGHEAVALAARFERAVVDAGSRHEAWKAGVARRDELAALTGRAEELAVAEDLAATRTAWGELQRRWAELAAIADQPDLRTRFEAAAARLHERERSAHDERERLDHEHLSRFTDLARRAEELARADDALLRDADHVLREVRAALEHPGHFPTRRDRDATLSRLDSARKRLYLRVQQLREDADWKRWANVDVQEELCVRAESLVQEQDPQAAARELRDLDARWKQAKEAPKEKAEELWTRFKRARDSVRERVDAFFAEQAEALGENLRRKEALCERAAALAESTDWVRTAEEFRRLQTEWKQIGPVPRAQSRRIWRRFRQPCDRFFSRWHEHKAQRSREWEDNLARKEALCARAETVQDSTDWESTAAELKRLQTEWRGIGAVRRSRSEAVWLRFHKACDHFFERYKHRDSLAIEAARQARERICAELEEILPVEPAGASPPEDLVGRVLAAQTAWRQAGELPADIMAGLDERFHRTRERLVEIFPQAFAGSELDPEASRRRAEKLVARVEGLVKELAPAGGGGSFDSTEELAARLRDALAANTMGGRAAAEARWHSASAEVESARGAWRRLGPLPGAEGGALLERFDRACRRFAELRPRGERSRVAPTRRHSRTRA